MKKRALFSFIFLGFLFVFVFYKAFFSKTPSTSEEGVFVSDEESSQENLGSVSESSVLKEEEPASIVNEEAPEKAEVISIPGLSDPQSPSEAQLKSLAPTVEKTEGSEEVAPTDSLPILKETTPVTTSSKTPEKKSEEVQEFFSADFEKEDWFKDFRSHLLSEVRWGLKRCKRVYNAGKKSNVLRVKYLKNELGPKNGGAYWRMYFPRRFEKIILSYDIRFDKNFDFGSDGKLPGLAGGGTVGDLKKPVSAGKPTGKEGWSMRVLWREEGKAVQSVFHADQPNEKGHSLPWKYKREWGDEEVKFIPGKWHRVKLEVTLNDPKKTNGRIRSWIDGVLVLDYKKIKNRTTEDIGIDSLYFDTYFGGPDPAWAPKKDEFIYFDNLVISGK